VKRGFRLSPTAGALGAKVAPRDVCLGRAPLKVTSKLLRRCTASAAHAKLHGMNTNALHSPAKFSFSAQNVEHVSNTNGLDVGLTVDETDRIADVNKDPAPSSNGRGETAPFAWPFNTIVLCIQMRPSSLSTLSSAWRKGR
jgi:hypothetical protein